MLLAWQFSPNWSSVLSLSHLYVVDVCDSVTQWQETPPASAYSWHQLVYYQSYKECNLNCSYSYGFIPKIFSFIVKLLAKSKLKSLPYNHTDHLPYLPTYFQYL